MDYKETIRKLVGTPEMGDLRELIIRVVNVITKKNISNLLLESVPDGIKIILKEIRKHMEEKSIPIPENDKDLYEEIIRPVYLKMIRLGI